MIRQGLHKARTSGVHGFLPQELLNFALPARRAEAVTWTRTNGGRKYVITAGTISTPSGDVITELPSGKYARAALLYLCTQAKLTGERELHVGNGYRAFVNDLGLGWQGAKASREAIKQLMLVSAATFAIIRQDFESTDEGEPVERYRQTTGTFSESMDLTMLWQRQVLVPEAVSTVKLSPVLMDMLETAAPISQKSWRWLLTHSKSPMALDVYTWLCGRLYRCDTTTRVSWQQLHDQFGSAADMKRFKQHFRTALETALRVYPEAQIREERGTHRQRGFKGFYLSPSPDPRDAKTPDDA